MDKVIIANRSAMAAKYGRAAMPLIDAALQRLVQADGARGLSTVVVEIDDPAQMQPYGGNVVAGPTDQRTAKDAVDAVYRRATPAYIVLLDGPDVVPHVALDRLDGLADGDDTIDSDLPYACDAAFSTSVKSYLAVTRVVGRLPMPIGSTDGKALVALLDRCATHRLRPPEVYAQPFSISAEPWQTSTRLSLNALFGSGAKLHLCPDAGHALINDSLAANIHFINCHGARLDHRFYGQRDRAFPVAMDSSLMSPHLADGTLVAAECCYGAELYDSSLAAIPQPICMAYLSKGAIAFVGSTTIAYGPTATNGQADLLMQYFVAQARAGESTGAAMLKARQRFVSTQVMSQPVNLKTLAQFVLYGDPSLHAIQPPTVTPSPPTDATAALAKTAVFPIQIDETERRNAHRIALSSNGKAVASASTLPGRRVKPSEASLSRLRELSRIHGFAEEPVVLAVKGGPTYRASAHKITAAARQVAVTTQHMEQTAERPFGLYRVLTAQILDSKIYSIEISESR